MASEALYPLSCIFWLALYNYRFERCMNVSRSTTALYIAAKSVHNVLPTIYRQHAANKFDHTLKSGARTVMCIQQF